jgi:hypothetical protein
VEKEGEAQGNASVAHPRRQIWCMPHLRANPLSPIRAASHRAGCCFVEEAQLVRMGRQHMVTWRMGRRRTTTEEEGVVRLMGSAGGGRNPRDRMGGRNVRAWGGPRSGGQTHAGSRREEGGGRREPQAGGVRSCGTAGRRRQTHN